MNTQTKAPAVAHTPEPPRPSYTILQFNGLPGWARDTILAQENEIAALREALEKLIVRSESAAFALYGHQTTTPESRLLAVALSDARAALAQTKGTP